jgi:hypothetical protein
MTVTRIGSCSTSMSLFIRLLVSHISLSLSLYHQKYGTHARTRYGIVPTSPPLQAHSSVLLKISSARCDHVSLAKKGLTDWCHSTRLNGIAQVKSVTSKTSGAQGQRPGTGSPRKTCTCLLRRGCSVRKHLRRTSKRQDLKFD